jgi:hypothetical protein
MMCPPTRKAVRRITGILVPFPARPSPHSTIEKRASVRRAGAWRPWSTVPVDPVRGFQAHIVPGKPGARATWCSLALTASHP